MTTPNSLPEDVDAAEALLAAGDYVADRSLATAVFLARVFLPVAAGNPPARAGDAVVDNGGRRVLPHLGLLVGALGVGGA